MKRHIALIVLFGGLLCAAAPLSAQTPEPSSASTAPAAPTWFTGAATLQLLGREDVTSSKFEEYRVIPKGVSMPVFNLQGAYNGNDYAILGKNISRRDQRYTGWGNTGWFGVAFDYNQIPHSMGLDAKTLQTEIAPGVWSMNATTRKALGDAVDAVAATARTYPFYLDLLGPTIAAAQHSDLGSLRERGVVTLDIGKALPFDLAFTYNNDRKTGYRGASGGDILGVVTAAVDVFEPLDEVTQDYGVRWNWASKKRGDVHATFNYNTYDDRIDSLIVDNPFRATDLAYTTTAAPGGPAQVRFSTPPDNQAIRGGVGAQLKFARQTRINADVAYGQWSQNAAFLPYTINSAVLTASGLPATAVASFQQSSLDGRIDTASYNLTFVSRPADRFSLRMHYRNYAYKDKSARFVIVGDTSGSPDRSWGAANAPTGEEPYGHANANRTDSSIGQFEAQASYDIGDLTIEGAYRNTQTSWEGRVGSSGTDGSEDTYSAAAVLHSNDWIDLRAHIDRATRTVSGIETGSVAAVQGVMADHAERDQTRIGADLEFTAQQFGLTFGYNRRQDDYPNRPLEVAGDARTESGLLEANYNMYSVDLSLMPSARAEVSVFYTYEKAAEVNQWVTLTSGALNNLLRYAPWNKGNTFGLNANFQLVPDKLAFKVLGQYQKIDGFSDITAAESGAFYNPGRTTLIPTGQGGAGDIGDYDDTLWETIAGSVDYSFGKGWTWSTGYAFDKYTNADAFSDGTTIFPQAVLFFLKANDGNYKTNVGFTRLTYRF